MKIYKKVGLLTTFSFNVFAFSDNNFQDFQDVWGLVLET